MVVHQPIQADLIMAKVLLRNENLLLIVILMGKHMKGIILMDNDVVRENTPTRMGINMMEILLVT